MIKFDNEWDGILFDEFAKPYYQRLREFLRGEYAARTVYPPMNDIFNALRRTSYSAVRAVLLGQDPYHGAGQAHGLCFSVRAGVPLPPSLANIFKELKSDLGVAPPASGDLTAWAERGVLLLNTALTVRAGEANSHRGQGWEIFTDEIIKILNDREMPIAFILWGNHARAKRGLITNPQHGVFEAAHPSPLSAHNGFFGCRHFSRVNDFLTAAGLRPLDWRL
ncbi:uracil-DNA glycosylase 2 [Planctomycetales bacterium]|nr:uracil-DNA glycosylase 2 [Planctomycetales bacterium]